MELFITLFLRAIAELIWPSRDQGSGNGNDVFIPFEDRHDHGNGDSQNGGSDPYFPDGDF